MPYSANEQLPEAVKNNLPSEAQTIWRQIFNNAYEQYKDDGKAAATAWAGLERAGWRKDSNGKWVKVSKRAIPYKKTPKAPESEPWDAGEEVKNATVDDLKVMCAWYDDTKPDVKASYKLLHHKAEGEHSVVWNGVRTAMAVLLGAMGGVDIPESDKEAVYRHLAEHYGDFGKEPPEFHKSVAKQFSIYVPISKLDDEQQIVFGWGSVTQVDGRPLVDTQGDVIEQYELEKAVYEFMLAPKHDEMHKRIVPDSVIVESFVVTDEKLQKMFPGGPIPNGNRGWWLGIKINDPEVYMKHKLGIYKGFSITGTATREEV